MNQIYSRNSLGCDGGVIYTPSRGLFRYHANRAALCPMGSRRPGLNAGLRMPSAVIKENCHNVSYRTYVSIKQTHVFFIDCYTSCTIYNVYFMYIVQILPYPLFFRLFVRTLRTFYEVLHSVSTTIYSSGLSGSGSSSTALCFSAISCALRFGFPVSSFAPLPFGAFHPY